VLTPFYAELTCYRVLKASDDARAASLLQRAAQRLRECAEQIADEAQRRLFLENVEAHRDLLRAASDTTIAIHR
jgi:hypothetical protein